MGFFTWTLANKTPVKQKSGEYAARSKLRYYGYGAIVCPDNTLIKEPCYEGYGRFNGQDVYELVLDWNKDYLTEIPRMSGFKKWMYDEEYEAILSAYQKGDQEALQAAIDAIVVEEPYMRTGWKRCCGIYIACENNDMLPFPIKIVDCVRPKPYSVLRPSFSTQ